MYVCVYLVTQWCPTFCSPMDYGPSISSCPLNFLGKNAGVGYHFPPPGIFLTRDRTCTSLASPAKAAWEARVYVCVYIHITHTYIYI